MSSPDLPEILQQRLQSPLSDSQLESVEELITADPKKYDVVLAEIRAQNIEIIPISLSADDDIDELVEWLTQLAATSNVGRGFNAVIGSIAVILVVVAIGFGITLFYSPTTGDQLTNSKSNRHEILKDPAGGDTENDLPDPGATETASETDHPDAGASVDDLTSASGLALPELPVTPQWLSFDDPAARLDHSWVKSLSRYIRQPLDKPGTLKPGELEGVIQHYDLEGDFLLPAPRDDGSSLRVRMSNIENMVITAENGAQKIELTYDGHLNLKRYEPLPVKEFVRHLAIDSEPRFRRHLVETRRDPVIDFNWALGSPVVNDQVVDPDYFAVQWKGFLVIPTDGRYVFHMVADDGVRLRINGVEVIDSWVVQPEIELSGEIDLTAGTFPIEVEFFSDRMTARVALFWESEKIPKQIIPGDSLRSSAGPDGRPGLVGQYCYGPLVEAVEVPAEQAVDLVDNDNGRWHGLLRSGFDLRFQDKRFIVARGDIPLTTIPMDSPPSVLKMQTKARLQYLEPLRLESLAGIADFNVNKHPWQPASGLPWYVLTDAPDSKGVYEIGDQGDVRLTRTQGSNPVHLQTRVPIDGSTDIYVLMKTPNHLTGIRFQHPQSGEFYSLYYLKMGDSYVISMNPTDLKFTSDQYRAGMRVRNHVWWRAHYGDSQFVISMSPDGEHWNVVHSLALDVALPRQREIVFGLTTVPGDERSTASIDNVLIETDQLIERLSTFLPVGSVPNIPLLKQGTRNTQKIDAFLAELESQKPELISPEKWRLACYAQALKTNLTPTMRQEALMWLLHHAILHHPDTTRVYEALVKLPQRLHIQRAESNLHSWQNLQHLYDMLAGRLWIEKKPEQLELLIDDWLMLPGGAGGRERYDMPVIPELLTRLHLYHLRQLGRWEELYQFATKFEYLSLSPHGKTLVDKEFSSWRMARWLHGESAEVLDQPQIIKPSDAGRFLTDRPVSVPTDRESVNAMRQILQAVETDDLDTAMKMITNAPIPAGLFPVDSAGIHFQSGGVYLRAILEDAGKLAETIRRENAALADLRLNKALDSNDMDALTQIAMRFRGTPAAVQAMEMLANHQLSAGQFLAAAQNYTELLEASPDGNRDLWQAKRKLALALSGQKSPSGVTTDVELEGEIIPKDEFNALLDQLVASRGRQYVKPSKANLTPKDRSVLSLMDMSLPGNVRSDERRTRQVTFLDLGKTLLVHQPARLTCFAPGTKQVVWKIEDSGQNMPAEYTYCGQPVLFGNGVFTSVFREKQFYWTLINPADGKPLWESAATGIPFADPIVAGTSIYVFVVTQQKTTFGQLSLQHLDSTTGELVSNMPLMNVQIDGDLFRSGRSTMASDQIVFVREGVAYSVSLRGELLWAQLLDRVPKLADQLLHERVVTTGPLVVGNKVLVHSQGSPSLICLDRTTGSPLWRHRQPYLQKLVGIYDDHVLLVCQTGIQSLHLDDGSMSWFYPVAVHPQSVLIHNDHVLALVLDKPQTTTQLRLGSGRELLWIHPKTGNLEHSFSLLQENAAIFDAEQIFAFDDQVVAVGNVNLSARTFKLLGLPVK
ncbi:MAG: PQQ-binding-like beta-propeller repeat protein [Planctomycetota bacterium]|nr:PQQ-binding-like beta-propeller repeat protein [Planctomycetota bacterium]